MFGFARNAAGGLRISKIERDMIVDMKLIIDHTFLALFENLISHQIKFLCNYYVSICSNIMTTFEP